MKFDKFGAFPKTESVKSQTNSSLDLSAIVKLLPSLFSKKKESSQKTQVEAPENKNPYVPSNAAAYAEYVARHDAFVKQSKGQ